MMRFLQSSFLLVVAISLCIQPELQAKSKKQAPHAAQAKAQKQRKPAHNKTVPNHSGKVRSTRSRKRAIKTPSVTWRNRQMAPSPDRCKEIQGALASKGYLKSEPTGDWDSNSQEAMRRFQADQNIDQTGKVNSRSLIALGLGPSRPAAPVVPPPIQNK